LQICFGKKTIIVFWESSASLGIDRQRSLIL
jgi:hypothetical protein